MKITNYPDGSGYVKVNEASLRDFSFRINTYSDLWILGHIVDAYKNIGIRPIITIPNLIDAQADRRFGRGQSFGLKLVCDFLQTMSADFKIFHPHNSEVVESLMDNVEIIDNSNFVKKVLGLIAAHRQHLSHYHCLPIDESKKILTDNLILMSSDAGGFKPLVKLCDKLEWQGETYSASKARSWNNLKSSVEFVQQIDRTDFETKDILIVDDISVRGGTFKGLASMLRKRNIGKLYLAVSHMTVQKLGTDPVTAYYDKVFTTNSKYDEYFVDMSEAGIGYDKAFDIKPPNLQVLKLF